MGGDLLFLPQVAPKVPGGNGNGLLQSRRAFGEGMGGFKSVPRTLDKVKASLSGLPGQTLSFLHPHGEILLPVNDEPGGGQGSGGPTQVQTLLVLLKVVPEGDGEGKVLAGALVQNIHDPLLPPLPHRFFRPSIQVIDGPPGDQGIYLGLLLSVLVFVLWPLAPHLMAWTGASPEVQANAASYMRIRLFGVLGLMLLMACDNFYRGIGRTDVPMWFGFVKVFLNSGANYIFIFGHLGAPELGAVGAAVGTAIANTVIGVAMFATLFVRAEFRDVYANAVGLDDVTVVHGDTEPPLLDPRGHVTHRLAGHGREPGRHVLAELDRRADFLRNVSLDQHETEVGRGEDARHLGHAGRQELHPIDR